MKNSNSQKRIFAFTLAEVLITLAVIGVVAALTIPTLMVEYQKNQVETQVKDTFAVIQNAIARAKVDYGLNISSWPIVGGTQALANKYFVDTYFLPYVKTAKACGDSTGTDCVYDVGPLSNLESPTKTYDSMGGPEYYNFTLMNGAVVFSHIYSMTGQTLGDDTLELWFDVNGLKKPNIIGKDVFVLTQYKNKIIPFGSNFPYSRAGFLSSALTGNFACDKNGGRGIYCLSVIVSDSWQIKSDYPW